MYGLQIKFWGDIMLGKEELYNNFISDFSTKIYNLKSDEPFSDYIFLCVGSDKITGDAFGPLVGDKLQKLFKNYYNNISVEGTLENTISATNIEEKIKQIYNKYKNPCIIAIDSALSNKEDIGKIIVTDTKMRLGKGTNKRMPAIGNISIKGIVAQDYKIARYNFSTLQNTSLNLVMKLANVTADGIYNVVKYR